MPLHPVYGSLVVLDPGCPKSSWAVRNSNVPLDTVLHLIDEGRDTTEILKRHVLLLRSDLVEITLLHALHG